MGLHLFISAALAIAGGLVAAAFGCTALWSVIIGVIVFALYWGVCIIIVDLDL